MSALLKKPFAVPLLLLIVFLISEVYINPTGDFPLNDDWSYSYSVNKFNSSGKIDLGYWPAMTLIGHVFWGTLFVKVFGFSHFVLRISTLVTALLSLIFIYKTFLSLKHSPLTAGLLTLFILFNPLWFILANSFMTDVPFMLSIIAFIYYAQRMFVSQKKVYLIHLTLCSLYGLSIRQFALAMPFSLLLAGAYFYFINNRRYRNILLCAIPMIISAAAYLIYDHFGQSFMSVNSAYQSGDKIFSGNILSSIADTITVRFSYCFLYCSIFLLPLSVVLSWQLIKKQNKKMRLISGFVTLMIFIISLNRLSSIPVLNYIYNFGLGPHLLYDTQIAGINLNHSSVSWFRPALQLLAVVGSFFLSLFIGTGIIVAFTKLMRKKGIDAFRLFLGVLAFVYLILLCISPSFFDRYILPFILIGIMLLSTTGTLSLKELSFAIPFLLIFYMYSVAGTRDYFTWHEAKQQLEETAIKNGVHPSELNGGFESVASKFYNAEWWNMWTKEELPYKICSGPLPGHSIVKTSVHDRMLPPGQDTLFLLHRLPTP